MDLSASSPFLFRLEKSPIPNLHSIEKPRTVLLRPREPPEDELEQKKVLPVKLRMKIAYQQAVQNYSLHFLPVDPHLIYIGKYITCIT